MTVKPNDLVGIKNRNLTHYATVIQILPNNEVRVRIKTAKQPKEKGLCDKCSSFNLSLNGGTGEIICMRSGCGHEHGFEQHDEIVKTDSLVNVSEQRFNEEKKKFKEGIVQLIKKGAEKGFLSKISALQLIEYLTDI